MKHLDKFNLMVQGIKELDLIEEMDNADKNIQVNVIIEYEQGSHNYQRYKESSLVAISHYVKNNLISIVRGAKKDLKKEAKIEGSELQSEMIKKLGEIENLI